MSFLIAGAIAAAAGSLVSGKLGASAAAKQAKAQKQAANRYAKALRQQASKMQGGMSQARLRSLQAAGSLQRASEAQQSRTEAARGGRAPSRALPLSACALRSTRHAAVAGRRASVWRGRRAGYFSESGVSRS